jgi:hypothetical protein
VKRHASDEELADLEAGVLRRRKAARIHGHVQSCTRCQQVGQDLVSVSTLLASASVTFPAMPDNLSVRVDAALQSEVTQRISAEPASEAGRRDLPVRQQRNAAQRRSGGRSGAGGWSTWKLPGLSVQASRLVGAVGAVAVIAGGGYAVSQAVTSSTGGPASSNAPNSAIRGGAALPAVGPRVTYRSDGSTHSIRAVQSDTNFTHTRLGAQAVAAVSGARQQGVVPMHVSHPASVPAPTRQTFSQATSGTAGPNAASRTSTLDACVANIAGDRQVLLVELAKYEGKPATIIVLAANARHSAEVWVAGASCSATDKDTLDHLSVRRT